jgi:thiamine kinase-like enzyme
MTGAYAQIRTYVKPRMDEIAQIVALLAPKLGEPEGAPTPLAGGITNRNFRARLGGRDYVIRLPGKDTSVLGIDRTAERIANQRAAHSGVAPPVAAMLEDPPCLVTEFIEAHEMSSEQLREPEHLSEVALALRTFHGSGDVLPTTFDSFRVVEDYAREAVERGAELPAAYEEQHAQAAEIEAALSGPEHQPVPCHNDLLAANFLHDGTRVRLVDWEYAGMGDRYFDLGNFAVNNEFDEALEAQLLEAYFSEPAPPRRRAALRLMRFMSDFREAMWGVVQGTVSDLDFDFAEYADKHFVRLRETAADPRFADWLRDARGG